MSRPTVRLREPAAPGPRGAHPLLALSLGEPLGIALRWDAARVGSGAERLVAPDQSPGARALRFRRAFRDLLDLSEPALVVFRRAPEVVAQWQEALLLAEVEGRTSWLGVGVDEGPPHLLDPLAAASARFARPVGDPRQADALLLLAWADDEVGPTLVPA